MEELKKLEEVTLPDRRTTMFVMRNRETGEKREFSIKDRHEEVESIKLDEAVPEEVRSEFNVARNLSLYSWYCYSFHMVACLKAFSTIELALKKRLGKPEEAICSLKRLLNDALIKGFLKDKSLPESIPYLRNLIAHGNPMNAPWSVMVLYRSAKVLNELFAGTQDSP